MWRFASLACNYENIAQKATVLTTMLSNSKIAPGSGLYPLRYVLRPAACLPYEYGLREEQEKKAAELAAKQKEVNPDGEGNQPDPGSGQKD